jgi:hypothetical protein
MFPGATPAQIKADGWQSHPPFALLADGTHCEAVHRIILGAAKHWRSIFCRHIIIAATFRKFSFN